MICWKIGYLKRKDADRKAKEASRIRRDKASVTLHSYRCQECGLWHLTSKSRQQFARQQRRLVVFEGWDYLDDQEAA